MAQVDDPGADVLWNKRLLTRPAEVGFVTKGFAASVQAVRPDVTLQGDFPLVEAGVVDALGVSVSTAHRESACGFKVETEDIVFEDTEAMDAVTNLAPPRSK